MRGKEDSTAKRLLSISFVLVAALTLVFLAAPFLGLPAYWMRFLTGIFMWVGLAGSWNVIGGYSGRVDFGHVVFFGAGMYIATISILEYGIPWWISLFLGGVGAVALAFLVGLPTLRLAGAYFAIATWALAEAIKQLSLVLKVTGGTYGLVPPPILGREGSYYLMFLAMLAMTISNYLIERSKFGYGLKALMESEVAAETLGVNTLRSKLLAFMVSALFPGIIGGVYALWIGYVYPYDAFSGLKTDQMVVMVFLGGVRSFLGPVIGAVFLQVVFEFLWTYFGSEVIYLILLGVLIVISVIFIPGGILGLTRQRLPRARFFGLEKFSERFRRSAE